MKYVGTVIISFVALLFLIGHFSFVSTYTIKIGLHVKSVKN